MYTEKLQALLLPGSSILRVVCTPRQLDAGIVELIRANIYMFALSSYIYIVYPFPQSASRYPLQF